MIAVHPDLRDVPGMTPVVQGLLLDRLAYRTSLSPEVYLTEVDLAVTAENYRKHLRRSFDRIYRLLGEPTEEETT